MLRSVRAVVNASALSRLFSTTRSLRLPIDMERVNTTERLSKLRELMKQNKVDIYSKTWNILERKAD